MKISPKSSPTNIEANWALSWIYLQLDWWESTKIASIDKKNSKSYDDHYSDGDHDDDEDEDDDDDDDCYYWPYEYQYYCYKHYD